MPKVAYKGVGKLTPFDRIDHVTQGKPVYHHRRKDGTAVIYTICCDCGLTHKEEYKPLSKTLRIRVWRDDQATERVRAKAKRNK